MGGWVGGEEGGRKGGEIKIVKEAGRPRNGVGDSNFKIRTNFAADLCHLRRSHAHSAPSLALASSASSSALRLSVLFLAA